MRIGNSLQDGVIRQTGDEEAELLAKFHQLKGREREAALTLVSELVDLRN